MLKLWSEFSDFLKKCKYFLNFIQGAIPFDTIGSSLPYELLFLNRIEEIIFLRPLLVAMCVLYRNQE